MFEVTAVWVKSGVPLVSAPWYKVETMVKAEMPVFVIRRISVYCQPVGNAASVDAAVAIVVAPL